MERTADQWIKQISVTSTHRGKNNYYTAHCPLCVHSEEADVISDSGMAELAAKSKIMGHIRREHSDSIAENPPLA